MLYFLTIINRISVVFVFKSIVFVTRLISELKQHSVSLFLAMFVSNVFVLCLYKHCRFVDYAAICTLHARVTLHC